MSSNDASLDKAFECDYSYTAAMFGWFSGSATRPPVLLKFRSSKTFIVVTVASAIFTDIFVYGIIVPVLPFALTSRANIDPDRIQTWISIFLAVYGAALLTAAPFCGWLADRTSSRRWPLIFGLLALGGSTVMLCVGNSIAVLATGRVLQGISAAVVWVVGLALLVDTCPDEVGQAMGYVGLSMSLAMLLAPLLGGIVFAASGYYAVFSMAFGLMVLDILLRVVMIEKKVAAKWLPPAEGDESKANGTSGDNRQSATDLEMNRIAKDDSQSWPTTSGTDTSETGTSPELSTEIPSMAEDRQTAQNYPKEVHPIMIKKFISRLPPVISLLASRRLLSALWGCTIQATLLTAFDSVLPLFVRDTFNWNSAGAGLIFLPIVVVSFFGPLVGWLTDKHGPRWYAIVGYTLGCPCLILLRLVYENTLMQKVLLCALLALVGLCLTLVLTPMMAEITYAVDAKARRHPPGFFGKNGAYAQAYSLFNMAWAAGCMIGPLLAGLTNEAHGWGTTTLILGCVSLFTAIPTAIWTGGSIFKKMRKRKEERREGEGSISPEGTPVQ
ncbi:hypothetical protein LTR37_008519 [Vermiconidia calcicola]|uniref:Uncharacterized protein n=1 Tax=Vermiconidia calcicola TaxID=1690605 RepID=A0ACC3NA70_9PEZI|nr:hypothetical protein LTR37_008519 [Vermiconidia calcicola]